MPKRALALAVERGATRSSAVAAPASYGLPAIEGIGGSYLYLVDRYGAETDLRRDFEPAEARREASAGPAHARSPHPQCEPRPDGPLGAILRAIFNFRQIRYFDIEGQQTALLSRAMTAPDDKIRIPLNESQDDYSARSRNS
jgi:4-hydroxyphenylpyruvate dioxygenase